MRVLHAYKVYRPDVEGGVPSAIAFAASARDGDISSQILVARGTANSGCTYTSRGVDVRAVASFGNLMGMPIAPSFPAALFGAARDVDVVAAHAPFPLNDLGLIGLPPRVGLVVHWHAEILGRRLLARGLEPLIRRTLARADRIIVSDAAIAESSRILQAHRERWEVVPFGIDTEAWAQLDAGQQVRVADLRNRYPRQIVSLGRLVPYKGYDILLQAMIQIDGRLLIMGTGPELQRLQRQAQDLNISDRVIFAGYVPDEEAKVLLQAARVFAFPSVTSAETFGIAQLQAMAAGLPIVNTTLPTAVPRVARDGLEAISVPPSDVAGLAAALSRLLDDDALALRLGRAGRTRAVEEYDCGRFTRRVQAIYREVHAGRSRR